MTVFLVDNLYGSPRNPDKPQIELKFEASLQRTRLGRSGLSVPKICLGTNNFGKGQIEKETANKIMARALDLGIDMTDTADVYCSGDSERIIGEFIKGRREDVILATKVGKEGDWYPDTPSNKSSVSRKNIIHRLDQSLDRLQTNYVDLLYVHRFDSGIPLKETMSTLDSLVKQGKVRYIACSNYTLEQLAESRSVAEKFGLENFIAVQNGYNLLRSEMEKDMIPYCQENGVGILAFSPLSSGFLAGRYERGKPPPMGSRATYKQPNWLKRYDIEENFRKLDNVKEVAARSAISLPVLAIAWVLRENKIASAIVGASKPEQLDDAATAVDTKLSDEALDDLNWL
jgi:1-deoxyxylulose-5-phosphate synthase